MEAILNAFHKLRNILASEDVKLMYPDCKKPFDLSTNASPYGIGTVLSQNRRPITMISRALKSCEAKYATNERELLAFVWALGKQRDNTQLEISTYSLTTSLWRFPFRKVTQTEDQKVEGAHR